MAIDFKEQLKRFRERQSKPSRVPPRPVKVRWNQKADRVLWRWLLGYDRLIKVRPVRRNTDDEVLMDAWMFERGNDGTYVRATKVMVAIHRRAKDRSKAGFKANPAMDAVNELCFAIRQAGGWTV